MRGAQFSWGRTFLGVRPPAVVQRSQCRPAEELLAGVWDPYVTRRLDERYRFAIGIHRIIRPAEWADKDKPLDWVTAEYNKELENLIRKDPAQYWWLHRRWKTRPKEERKAAKK